MNATLQNAAIEVGAVIVRANGEVRASIYCPMKRLTSQEIEVLQDKEMEERSSFKKWKRSDLFICVENNDAIDERINSFGINDATIVPATSYSTYWWIWDGVEKWIGKYC